MEEDITQAEYTKLLIGLSGDTPLGYVVGIRSEKDPKRIKQFTAQERKIRADWLRFLAQKTQNEIPQDNDANTDRMRQILSSLFGRG
jgi:hypothetical protein